MKRFMNKKVAAIAAAAGLTLGLGGAAFAYFTTHGSGTSSGSVGTTSDAQDWGVTFPGPVSYTGGADAIYPGITEMIPVTITNNAFGFEGLQSVSVALKTSGDDVADSSGADIPGCLASWWSVSVTNSGLGFGTSMPPTSNDAETVSLTLNDDSTHSQDACENALPGFVVTAG